MMSPSRIMVYSGTARKKLKTRLPIMVAALLAAGIGIAAYLLLSGRQAAPSNETYDASVWSKETITQEDYDRQIDDGIKQAEEKISKNESVTYEDYLYLAQSYKAKKNTQKALEYYEKAKQAIAASGADTKDAYSKTIDEIIKNLKSSSSDG